VAVKADVSVPAEVAALFDKAEESFGGIDIIVNKLRIKVVVALRASGGRAGSSARVAKPLLR
jgi:NAD(P)-dependent dehydrogenase (short-subunit alcohol dehydrogenase family)